jgi:ethanolamine ammonia-lyase large subunit
MTNVACLGNWTRIEIEDQGIVINDTPDQDLRKIGTRLMSERMEAIEIEDQGIVIKDTPDQDLRKIGTGLMSERMEANMKSQNIMIKKVTGQSLMKGSTILKVNLVKIEIRSQSIVIEVIEGVPGQYHQKVSMTKEALHHIETRTILNTKDSGQNLLMPSITATMIMKIKMKDQSIKRNPCLN